MIRTFDRFIRKAYAMKRMVSAIERAILLRSSKNAKRAARWGASWGLLCGIRTDRIRLRAGDAGRNVEERHQPRRVRIESPFSCICLHGRKKTRAWRVGDD
jgi:hypothetical protein